MSSNAHPVYRPEVDGLRAIAVLAVVAFHASARLMPGGFAGVDIFFVISGYLITSLIYKGLEAGNFSFTEFYTRRIKRILPAYIAVAVATLAVSTYLLIPNDYIFYTTSLAASWGFAANIFFSMLSWGYFGQRSEEFPLLHTWSLSVEEQFYFVFPILLLVLFRYFRQHMISVLLVLGVLFLSISELRTGEAKSYFLLTSRAHELIIGALTFFMLQKFPVKSRVVSNLLAVTGIALVLGSLFLLTRGTPFPGINSLYPCIGAALLIYSCSTENVLTPVLKNNVMVFIGLISYSLYLWHWPIFSFLRYRRIDISFWVGMAAIATSFALAILSWKFIEKPIRNNRKTNFRNAFFRYYFVPTAIFMSVGLYSYMTEGAPKRFPDDIRQLISSYSFERDLTRACSIRPNEYSKVTLNYLTDHCAFGDMEQQKAQILLIGDSHAHHFKPFVEQLSRNAKLKSVYHVQGSCFPIYLPDSAAPNSQASTCEKRNADLLELSGNFKYVVLAGFWSSEKNNDFENRLRYVVNQVTKAGATPVIFKDNPYYEPDLSQCILYKKRGWIAADKNCNIPYRFVTDTQASDDAIIDKIKLQYPGTIIIDPKRMMCNSSECATSISNIALYKDANHINAKAAKMLADTYLATEGNPFSNAGVSRAAADTAGINSARLAGIRTR